MDGFCFVSDILNLAQIKKKINRAKYVFLSQTRELANLFNILLGLIYVAHIALHDPVRRQRL